MDMNRAGRNASLCSSEQLVPRARSVTGNRMGPIEGGEVGQSIPLAWDATRAAGAQQPTPAPFEGRKRGFTWRG